MSVNKNILFAVTFIVSFFVSQTVFAEDALTVEQVKSTYNIVEGDYELVESTDENCIAGAFKLNLNGDSISLMSDLGSFASFLEKSKSTFIDRGCSSKYSTRVVDKGFENREEVHCPTRKVSYVRLVKAVFDNDELTYSLKTLQVFKNIRISRVCKLKKKEA